MDSADPLEDEARKLPQKMLELIHDRKPNLSAEILFAMFAGMILWMNFSGEYHTNIVF